MTTVAAHAARYALPTAARASLEAMVATARDDPQLPAKWRETVVDLVEDSLTALELPFVRSATRVADLGSGSGVPGLVLAAALPQASFTLVDRFEHNCAYIRRAAAAMGLANVEVVASYADAWAAEHRGSFDLVVSRNVRPVNVMAPAAALLDAAGGRAIVWSGEKGAKDAEIAAPDAATGLRLVDVLTVQAMAKQRYLFVYEKLG